MSTKKLIIATFIFIFLLAGSGGGVWMVLANFEQISEEGITFKKIHSYVAVDNLAVPMEKGRKYSHYMVLDAKIEISDKKRREEIFAKLPFFKDAALRMLHRNSSLRTDGVPGIDLRAIKERLKEEAVAIYGEKLVVNVLVTKVLLASN